MSKNKSNTVSGNAAKTGKKNKTNEDHLVAAMKDITKILELSAKGMDTTEIASKVKVGISYVAEVVSKGVDTMEDQLRAGYGMPAKDATTGDNAGTGAETVNTSPIDTVTESKAEKVVRIKAEKAVAKGKAKAEKEAAKAAKAAKKAEKPEKVPSEIKAQKEKRTRENAILKSIEESNGAGCTLEAIGKRANEILSIDRKSWTGTLGAMKRANEISYNKETKLYNVVV